MWLIEINDVYFWFFIIEICAYTAYFPLVRVYAIKIVIFLVYIVLNYVNKGI